MPLLPLVLGAPSPSSRQFSLLPTDSPLRGNHAAAVCLSGQVRSLLDVHQTLRQRLVDPFVDAGGAQVFLHVSLTSSFIRYHDDDPPMNETMRASQLEPALQTLSPTAVQIYEEGSAFDSAAASLQPSTCYRNPAEEEGADWTYNGVQFWGVSRCFALIAQAEAAMGRQFRFAIRARPD
eukprot:7105995-Prymnesium_polylepis.1